MTHAVATRKLCCLVDRDIVVHTYETVNPCAGLVQCVSHGQGKSNRWTSLMDGERGPARKIVAKMPPEFLRVGCSLVEYDLTIGAAAGTSESLTTLGRRVGLVDKYLLLGSRAEMLLRLISILSGFRNANSSYLLNFGSSTRRDEPDPDRGVYAVRLDDPPSSLFFRPETLLTSLDFGRPYT